MTVNSRLRHLIKAAKCPACSGTGVAPSRSEDTSTGAIARRLCEDIEEFQREAKELAAETRPSQRTARDWQLLGAFLSGPEIAEQILVDLASQGNACLEDVASLYLARLPQRVTPGDTP